MKNECLDLDCPLEINDFDHGAKLYWYGGGGSLMLSNALMRMIKSFYISIMFYDAPGLIVVVDFRPKCEEIFD